MRKKDRLIKEAFEIYQSANQEEIAGGKKGRGEIEYTEGFEDKICRCIEKLEITNPRQKARKICIGILLLFVVCISGGFLIYHHVHKSVNATKEIDALYREAYGRLTKLGYSPGTVQANGSNLRYTVVRLNTEMADKLEASNIKYHKVEDENLKTMSAAGGLEGGICGTGIDWTVWNVYELSDRDSNYYYILKDNGEQIALARYAGVSMYVKEDNRADVEEVCKKVYGIESAKDIRTVTLERYQSKSENNPEKLVAMYTKEQSKKYILSLFQQNNIIREAWEGYDEEEGNETNADVRWQPIEKLKQKGWKDAVELMPENCYLLALENKYHENFLMGVVKEGDKVQIFVDMKQQTGYTTSQAQSDEITETTFDGDAYCVQLSSETQKEIADWIDKAEVGN